MRTMEAVTLGLTGARAAPTMAATTLGEPPRRVSLGCYVRVRFVGALGTVTG
jgi:hypothetical protein